MEENKRQISFGRFKRRKKTQSKRGLLIVVLLIITILIWFNAEAILSRFF